MICACSTKYAVCACLCLCLLLFHIRTFTLKNLARLPSNGVCGRWRRNFRPTYRILCAGLTHVPLASLAVPSFCLSLCLCVSPRTRSLLPSRRQTRMLFNQNFSARFTSAKLFATERERQQTRGWVAGDSEAVGTGARRDNGGGSGGGGGGKDRGGGGSGSGGSGSASPPLKPSTKSRGSRESALPPPPRYDDHAGGEGRGSALPPVRHSAHHYGDGGRSSSRTKAA